MTEAALVAERNRPKGSPNKKQQSINEWWDIHKGC